MSCGATQDAGNRKLDSHFLFTLLVTFLYQVHPGEGSFLRGSKAVFARGCVDHWILADPQRMPQLMQMTLCVDVRPLHAEGEWTAFTYSTLPAPHYSLALQGDTYGLYVWLLGVQHHFPTHLAPLRWHHVCLQHDTYRRTMTLEVDGEVFERTVITRAIPPAGELVLGCRSWDVAPAKWGAGGAELYLFRIWDDVRKHLACEDGSVVGWDSQDWHVIGISRFSDDMLLCGQKRARREALAPIAGRLFPSLMPATAVSPPSTTKPPVISVASVVTPPEPLVVKCSFSEFCAIRTAYYWMSVNLETSGKKSEAQISAWLSQVFSISTCVSSNHTIISTSSDRGQNTCKNETETAVSLLEDLEVTCNTKVDISVTNCTVLLQLSQPTDNCMLRQVLQESSLDTSIQARVLGEVERVGKGLCQNGDTLTTDDGYVRCTSSTSFSEVCSSGGPLTVTCTYMETAYIPMAMHSPISQLCNRKEQQYCNCSDFCRDTAVYYLLDINILSAAISITDIRKMVSQLSSAQPCKSPVTICQSFHLISAVYQGAHLECHGTDSRLYSCRVVLKLSQPVEMCLASEVMLYLLKDSNDIRFNGTITRAAICGWPSGPMDDLLNSTFTWVSANLNASQICDSLNPVIFSCMEDEILGVFLMESCRRPTSPPSTTTSSPVTMHLSRPTVTPSSTHNFSNPFTTPNQFTSSTLHSTTTHSSTMITTQRHRVSPYNTATQQRRTTLSSTAQQNTTAIMHKTTTQQNITELPLTPRTQQNTTAILYHTTTQQNTTALPLTATALQNTTAFPLSATSQQNTTAVLHNINTQQSTTAIPLTATRQHNATAILLNTTTQQNTTALPLTTTTQQNITATLHNVTTQQNTTTLTLTATTQQNTTAILLNTTKQQYTTVLPLTATTQHNATAILLNTTKQQYKTALPLTATTQQNTTAILPNTTTQQNTTAIPLTSTKQQNTTAVPLTATTQQNATDILHNTTTQQNTTALPLTATTQQNTKAIMLNTTTQQNTTALPLTATTQQNATVILLNTTKQQYTTALPLTATTQQNATDILLNTITKQNTTALPLTATTQQNTTALPLTATTQQNTTAILLNTTKQQYTTALPLNASPQQNTTAILPNTTTQQNTTAVPLTATTQHNATAILLNTTTHQNTTAMPLTATRQQNTKAITLNTTTQQNTTAQPLTATTQQNATAILLNTTKQQQTTALPLTASPQQNTTAILLNITTQQNTTAVPLTATTQQNATDIILNTTTQQNTTALPLSATTQQYTAAVPLTATTQQNATAFLLNTTVQQNTTALPPSATAQQNITAILQNITTQQNTTALPLTAITQQNTTALPLTATTQQNTTAILLNTTKQQYTTALPLNASPQQNTTAILPNTTTQQNTTAVPLTATTQHNATAILLNTTTHQNTTAMPLTATRQQNTKAITLNTTTQQNTTAQPLTATTQQNATAILLNTTKQQQTTALPLTASPQQNTTAILLNITTQQNTTAVPLTATTQQNATDIILNTTTQQNTTALPLSATTQQYTAAVPLTATKQQNATAFLLNTTVQQNTTALPPSATAQQNITAILHNITTQQNTTALPLTVTTQQNTTAILLNTTAVTQQNTTALPLTATTQQSTRDILLSTSTQQNTTALPLTATTQQNTTAILLNTTAATQQNTTALPLTATTQQSTRDILLSTSTQQNTTVNQLDTTTQQNTTALPLTATTQQSTRDILLSTSTQQNTTVNQLNTTTQQNTTALPLTTTTQQNTTAILLKTAAPNTTYHTLYVTEYNTTTIPLNTRLQPNTTSLPQNITSVNTTSFQMSTTQANITGFPQMTVIPYNTTTYIITVPQNKTQHNTTSLLLILTTQQNTTAQPVSPTTLYNTKYIPQQNTTPYNITTLPPNTVQHTTAVLATMTEQHNATSLPVNITMPWNISSLPNTKIQPKTIALTETTTQYNMTVHPIEITVHQNEIITASLPKATTQQSTASLQVKATTKVSVANTQSNMSTYGAGLTTPHSVNQTRTQTTTIMSPSTNSKSTRTNTTANFTNPIVIPPVLPTVAPLTISTTDDATMEFTTVTMTTASEETQADKLLEQTRNISALNSSQVEQVVSRLEDLLSGPNVTLALGHKLLDIVSNLLNASANTLAASSSRIIRAVETLGLKLVVQSRTTTISSDSLALAVRKVDGDSFEEMSFSITDPNNLQIGVRGEQRARRRTGNLRAPTLGTITLPASLTINLTVQEQLLASRVQFIFYQKTTVFQDNALGNRSLNSGVLATSVANLSISGLRDNVVFTLQNNKPIQGNFVASCVFWDLNRNERSGGWSSDGCTVENMTDEETICSCNHLTSFAVLLDLSREGITDRLQAIIQTFITFIGCGISAIFLSITVLTYLAFEKLRRDIPSKILIQLCTALLLLNLTFLLDSWLALYSDAMGLCISTAFFLHYFLLVSFTWMGLEAFHMYLAIVKVFNSYMSRYMLKFSLFGWGVPLIVVIVVIAINKDNYGLISYGKYTDGSTDEFCWIKNDVAFYVAVVAYFCLVFVVNLAMFVVVMVQLSRIKQQNPHNSQHRNGLQELRSVAGLTFLLGLTWGFAFFAWGPVNLAFMYLFAILNSLQGFFIFVFHCALKDNVRRQWRAYLCCGRLQLPESTEWSLSTVQANNKKDSVFTGTSFQTSGSNLSSSTSFRTNESTELPSPTSVVSEDSVFTSSQEPNGDVVFNSRQRAQRPL
ncbi:uncharacterized protein adgrg2a isoform X2 [Anguilla anguilla]|uniref:Adhesion G-protein coupled receptor G2 n=2 Tax=Anguilla anguilla TaxID=7936 RepID=A0A9D3MM03_ANGAN|nr:uncharacterized protein adgrg2a isoform X2 [Anguilla anguilla]KAG5850356.1 hypothetical protein ANANG_G00081450 [Anguilla anguilla]